uniref:Flavonoid 3'-hydroxylase n=1 Tax=Pohlia nutans TaxID=140635 RepID=W5XJ62_9BRYO|nr:flavonoid 3'-hydroxylase [Pohlia nutans]
MEKLLQFESGSSMTGVVALGVLMIVSVLLLLLQGRKNGTLPPGPRPAWPVLGNFPALMGGQMPFLTLHKLSAQFGPLMYLRLGSVPCVVISSSEVAKEVLQVKGASFAGRPKRYGPAVIAGTSDFKNISLAPPGPYWRQLRKSCTHELFSPSRLASYEGARTDEIRIMLKELLIDSKKGDAVDVRGWLTGVTANNITRMLIKKRFFGKGPDINQEQKKDFERLIYRIYDEASAFLISDYIPYLQFVTELQGWTSRFKDIRNELTSTLLPRIFEVEKHKQRAKERELSGDSDSDYVPDFVDLLVGAPLDDGKPLSDNDISMMLTDLFLGARGTSATTAEWALAEFVIRPELMKRAQDELDTVVGKDRLLRESDLPHLHYLNAFVKEIFRFRPPAPFGIPRESTRACEVLGYSIPAHALVLVNQYSVHRDPSVYRNPNEFDPERFMEQPEVNHLSGVDFFQLIPFGAGLRTCPGNKLGNLLVLLMLGNLLHHFDWSLPPGECADSFDMSGVYTFVCSRKKPLFLIAKPRSPALLLG